MIYKKIYGMSFFATALLLAALSTPLIYLLKTPKLGTIVLLNGTSSAGKTTIIQELQKIYGNSYVAVFIDDFLNQYKITHPIEEAKEDYMRELCSAFFLNVKQLSLDGKNVLIDTVQFDEHYEHYCSILNCKKTLKILVYCPLDTIVDRVEQRNKSENTQEHRTINQVFPQFKDIYKAQDSANEMVVDHVLTSRIKYALQIAVEEVRQLNTKEGKDPEANIPDFVAAFTQQFKLDTLDEITLVPQHSWDLIVNTGTHLPAEIAQTIAQKIKGLMWSNKSRH